jgi:ABC-type xylose transport system substrate-binding protein
MSEIVYQRRWVDAGKGNWEPVSRELVEKALGKYYQDLEAIMAAVDEGVQAHTPLAIYRRLRPRE